MSSPIPRMAIGTDEGISMNMRAQYLRSPRWRRIASSFAIGIGRLALVTDLAGPWLMRFGPIVSSSSAGGVGSRAALVVHMPLARMAT